MASDSDIRADSRGIPAFEPSPARQTAPPWEQRILQFDGKRYSLRLEHEFWLALQSIAAGRKLRLNRLVADIASRRPADGNLSSILRVFCLAEMEKSAAARSLALDGAGITALVESAPAPGMMLDAEQTILAVNDALVAWSGAKRSHLLRQKLVRHFRLQASWAFDALWATPPCDGQARIVGITPGRVLAAEARLVPVLSARGRRLCTLWIAASPCA